MPDVITVKDLMIMKESLESQLQAYLSDRVSDFTKTTGIGISGIHFDVIETTRFGGPLEYIVGAVHVRLNL